MIYQRLLKRARELIAERLAQAQLRVDTSVKAYHLTEKRLLELEPVKRGPRLEITAPGRLAGEIVVTSQGVSVVPFLVRVRSQCSEGAGLRTSEGVNPDFPYSIPKVNGADINASTPPILSTQSSGIVWAKYNYVWSKWVYTDPDFGETREIPFSSFLGVEVVSSPLGDVSFPPDLPPAYTETQDPETLDVTISITPASGISSYYSIMGWWENGGGPVQFALGGNSRFGVTFPIGGLTAEDYGQYEVAFTAQATLRVSQSVV
jgi:hypothetical protein